MATINAVNLGLSGVTGSGSFVGSVSPTFTGTPILSTASATSLTFTSTSGIIGTTTNDNAAALSVGQIVSSVVAVASAISLSNGIPANVTSISLTAGDWDVWGNVGFGITSQTAISNYYGWVSATSATLPDLSLLTTQAITSTSYTGATSMSVPTLRFSLSATTTIYLTAEYDGGTGTITAYGGIYARRRR